MKVVMTVDMDWHARVSIAGSFCKRTGQNEKSSYTDAEKKPATRAEVKAYLAKVMPYVLANPNWLLREMERDADQRSRDMFR